MKTITRNLFGSLSGDAAISSTAFGAQGFATAGLTVKHSPSQASVSRERSGPPPGLSRSWPTNDLNEIVGTQVLCECGLHLLCVQFCVSLCCLYRLVKRQAD